MGHIDSVFGEDSSSNYGDAFTRTSSIELLLRNQSAVPELDLIITITLLNPVTGFADGRQERVSFRNWGA